MPHLLSFISDDDLYKHTRQLVKAAQEAANRVEDDPYRNVIDPFSAVVDAARQRISIAAWMNQEKARQTQKGFQNALGDFHQDVVGSMPGWENAGRGGSFDVRNAKKKVIAEIKNKYNTMNARSALSVYDSLARHLDYGDPGFKAYVVDIIPKDPRPYDRPFTPSERGIRRQTRANLTQMDGKSFYKLASGETDALLKLYQAMPTVLSDIFKTDPKELTDPDDFMDLFTRAYIE